MAGRKRGSCRLLPFLAALTLYAQPSSPPSIIFVTSDPAGACSLTVPLRFNTTNAKLWGCSGGTWTQIGSGGGGGGTIGGAVTGGTANYNLIVDGSSNLGQGNTWAPQDSQH